MNVWFLLLVAALALSDASPTPNSTHDHGHDDDHDNDHGHDDDHDNDHGDGHDDHGYDHGGDHGHGGAHNGTYDIEHIMMHGGLCKVIMYELHKLMMGMGMDDQKHIEKAYGIRCDEHGNFEPKQCHKVNDDEEWCACVDIYTGDVVPNTMTKGKLMCDEHGKIPMDFCPEGWSYFTEHHHEHCFKFFPEPKTWVEAEGYCQFEGGHLATVHCPETEHFLQVLSRGDTHNFPITWLGSSNAVKTCFWFWLSGALMDYENFENDEVKYRNDSCLQLNHACGNQFKWGSGSCEELRPFICALDLMGDDYYYYH